MQVELAFKVTYEGNTIIIVEVPSKAFTVVKLTL